MYHPGKFSLLFVVISPEVLNFGILMCTLYAQSAKLPGVPRNPLGEEIQVSGLFTSGYDGRIPLSPIRAK
jgi:hypothetical protein